MFLPKRLYLEYVCSFLAGSESAQLNIQSEEFYSKKLTNKIVQQTQVRNLTFPPKYLEVEPLNLSIRGTTFFF